MRQRKASKMNKSYIPTIGLEIHIELATKSKMFCGCSVHHFGVKPNSHTCPVCLGLPGALPVPNKSAIEHTIMMGLALGCEISQTSKFDRKHYNYPDLPKGFQISQYDMPFCQNGKLVIPGMDKVVRIKRVHLEEDTGKLVHRKIGNKDVSLVDFNRSGVPLLEIVTEPDLSSGEEAVAFSKELQNIGRYLKISDCDMEKGSMRLEVNISLTKTTEKIADYKVEVKNINSFRYSDKSINYEIIRQSKILDSGITPKQETRGWNEKNNSTVPQRFKETEDDYRYFPEPDIPPIKLSKKFIQTLGNTLPDLPDDKRKKLLKAGVPAHFIDMIVRDPELTIYVEKAIKTGANHEVTAKTISTVIVNQKLHEKYPEPAGLIKYLIKLQKSDFSNANDVKQATEKVVNKNPDVVNSYRNGKTQVIGFLIGQTQKLLKGKGDPKMIREILVKLLHS
ncbi:Asp-tRNA(Asn)/Glu-tRNA(Gln) amidotransferase subunit GatB [Patescibacteria group bacterium]